MEETGIIYKATNMINGKAYIGLTTKTLAIRAAAHKNQSKYGVQVPAFYRAIGKYGFENFKWEELCTCLDWKTLNLMEQKMIKKHRTLCSEWGYNIVKGGQGTIGWNPSKETREKLREKRKLYVITEETKAKMSASKKDKQQKPEDIAKRVASNTGKKRSPEAIENLRKGQIGIEHKGKEHIIIYNCKEIQITNLVKFCKDNNLPYQRSVYRMRNNVDLTSTVGKGNYFRRTK